MCVLSMVVVTMVIVGLVLAAPAMLEVVPLNTLQRLQGKLFISPSPVMSLPQSSKMTTAYWD